MEGPGFDFTSSPTANVALAKQYMEKAGYENGMYDGPALLTIADNESPAKEAAEAFQEQVKAIGLDLQFREVPHATMLTKFCQVPASNMAICPNLGWGADFFAAQSFFVPLFYGQNIVPAGTSTPPRWTTRSSTPRSTRRGRSPTPRRRRKAWADLDKEVTSQAYFIPWLWDNNIGLAVDEHERSQQRVQLGRLRLRVQLVQVGRETTKAMSSRPRRPRAGASLSQESGRAR